MKEFQRDLVNAWNDFVAGRIDGAALKGHTVGFGIYPQRDGCVMMRVRRLGGRIAPAEMRALAAILRRHGGAFAHLTSRQDVQLHCIPADQVVAALESCEAAGFPFRGGGGDTFRNVRISSHSGLHRDSVFDVAPYARALSRAFYAYDLAYALPRKLKIAFADRPADSAVAQANDLGFVARVVDGRRVFETFLGGGLGFRPRLGLKVFDALPAADCIRAARALTRLFNDKGCRTNRAHARIRFLREDFGDEAFARLFGEYFDSTPPEAAVEPEPSAPPAATSFAVDAAPLAGYDEWRQLACTDLANGLCAVRVFVPFGNLAPDELDLLAAAFSDNGVEELEILPTLDFGLIVPRNRTAAVYNLLSALPRDYVARSFVGNVRTCIGCTVCKSGATDAPAAGRAVAELFDTLRPLDTPKKIAVARMLLDDVRISGCPNSCTAQQLAKLGFAGRGSPDGDRETVYTPAVAFPPALGVPDPAYAPISLAELPRFVLARCQDSAADLASAARS